MAELSNKYFFPFFICDVFGDLIVFSYLSQLQRIFPVLEARNYHFTIISEASYLFSSLILSNHQVLPNLSDDVGWFVVMHQLLVSSCKGNISGKITHLKLEFDQASL